MAYGFQGRFGKQEVDSCQLTVESHEKELFRPGKNVFDKAGVCDSAEGPPRLDSPRGSRPDRGKRGKLQAAATKSGQGGAEARPYTGKEQAGEKVKAPTTVPDRVPTSSGQAG